ncbi:hypothetical protein GCM10010918_18040 [Paenibacillus radicis (ex Gao et al. 2016)]|uniref:Uncharacterized protein n=2 Tax=Paenibacillus TaxID=44249 RepID=A0A917H1A1_9BACL|nr:hypothetical protein GCM10010918_18040 [Paenibacillus radicis (ex Gao et al. 2016)]
MLQMAWYSKALGLVGQPVGVSLTNGQGVTGVLCSLTGGSVVLQEYLYQSQFATKQYPFNTIRDINGFPGCAVPGPLF